MIDPNKKEREPANPSEVCHRAFQLIAAKQYGDAEKLLANNMTRSDDDAAIALYHSVMGVLFKVRGEYKTAWKHYQRAEKLLPDDPALKIISARLLIGQFAEYGQAIKKAKKVLSLLPDNLVFAHQAYITMGLAYCRKGDKRKAISMLEESCIGDFKDFISGQNIDFELVEALLRKGWGVEACYSFLAKARAFVEETGEGNLVNLLDRMLVAFKADYPQAQISSEPMAEVLSGEEDK